MTDPAPSRVPVEELAEEFLARRRAGERIRAQDYADAHPELAGEILDLFPTMLALEKLGDENEAAADGDAAQPPGTFEHPAQLGDLRLLREIGRGGMGIVYEAEQESLGRRVAVKILPERALFDTKRLDRFRREARTAGALQHPNIVPIYGVGEQDGLHYLSMQLIEGAGLDVLTDLVGARVADRSCDGQANGDAAPTAGPKAITLEFDDPDANPDANGKTQSAGWFAESLARALLEDDFSKTSSVDLSSPTLADPIGHASGSSRSRVDAPTIDLSQAMSESAAEAARERSSRLAEEAARSLDAAFSNEAAGESGGANAVGNDYFRSVAKLGVQAAEALAYAHARGTLHRDIKPANLLLDRRGNVWITDFGLAKAMDGFGGDAASVSRSGELVGTLRYMAPEQFQGQASPRSDLYSLGLTLYELIAWRPAFVASAPSDLLRQITTDGPAPPRKLNPATPVDLETIVLKATARDPEERYQSGDDLAADLRRFMEGIPVEARREGVAGRVARWTRSNPLVAGLATAVVLLGATTLLATGGYFASGAASEAGGGAGDRAGDGAGDGADDAAMDGAAAAADATNPAPPPPGWPPPEPPGEGGFRGPPPEGFPPRGPRRAGMPPKVWDAQGWDPRLPPPLPPADDIDPLGLGPDGSRGDNRQPPDGPPDGPRDGPFDGPFDGPRWLDGPGGKRPGPPRGDGFRRDKPGRKGPRFDGPPYEGPDRGGRRPKGPGPFGPPGLGPDGEPERDEAWRPERKPRRPPREEDQEEQSL